MKKISIILSAALLAATFALAGCSNVSELNGTEWDIYSAAASGKTVAQVQADNAAAAKKVTITVAKGTLLKEDAKIEFASSEATPAESYTWTLATPATAAVNAATSTVTFAGVTYSSKAIAAGDKTVTFESGSQPGKLKYASIADGSTVAATTAGF